MGLSLAVVSASEPQPVCTATYPYTAGQCYATPGYLPEALALRQKYNMAIYELGLQVGDFKIVPAQGALIVHVKEQATVYKLNSLADRMDIPVPQNPNARRKAPGSYEPPLTGLF